MIMVLKKAKRAGNRSLEVSEIVNIIDPERLPVGLCWIVSLSSANIRTHATATATATEVQSQGPGDRGLFSKRF